MELRKVIKGYVVALVFGFGISAIWAGFYTTAEAADWPNWRGPNYNGVSSETGWNATWPKGGPKVPWKKSIGTGFASIAVSNGRVYAMGNIDDKDILYCLDAETGKAGREQFHRCLVPFFRLGRNIANGLIEYNRDRITQSDGRTMTQSDMNSPPRVVCIINPKAA